jgi:hypothetical protein
MAVVLCPYRAIRSSSGDAELAHRGVADVPEVVEATLWDLGLVARLVERIEHDRRVQRLAGGLGKTSPK